MTPNQITTLIASRMDKELDIPFRLQLMERVKYWRSKLVGDMLSKKPERRAYFLQSIYMKMVPVESVPCAPEISCMVSVTEDKIPKILETDILFDYVGGADGRSPFRRVTPGMEAYAGEGRFSHLFPAYEYTGGRIYSGNRDLPLIRIDDVFDDPMQAAEYSCKTDQKCDTWNTEYPCTGRLLQQVVQYIIQVDYGHAPVHPVEKEIEVDPEL